MLPDTAVAQGQMVDAYLRWTAGLDQVAANDPPAHADVEKLLGDMEKLVNGNDKVAHFVAQRLARKVFESTNKVAAVLTADALRMCAVAAGPNGVKLVAQEVTAAWGGLQHAEARFNKDIAELLIRRQLLNLPDVDQALAKGLTLRLNGAIEFGITLAKACREGLCGASDISNTLDLLAKVTSDMQGGQQVLQLLAAARASSRARAAERAGLPDLAGLREKADPQGLHQQVAGLFEEFARRCMAAPDDKVHSVFVQQLRSTGLLNLDDTTDRMLRILVELAVQHCLQNESAGPPRADGSLLPGPLSFLAVDPLVKLVVCLTTQHGGSEKFLGRTLSVTAALVRRDAEDKGLEFNCRPYLRLLVGLATEVGGGEAAIGSTPEPGSMRLLRLIGLTLLALQPTTVPGFAFAYLELLSHRSFMPRLLMAPQQGGWQLFEALLVGLLQFLEPGLRAAELTEPLRLLYKGTLRLLLVLLHDFPEFLCEHHFNLCDVIPAPAIQMRNLILSAFPRNMRLPDPFTPNLKVDLLPEINNPPRGTPPPEALLPPPVRSTVDALLAGRAPASALPQLVAWLGLPLEQRALGGNYNVPLINALVLYLASTSTPGAPVLPSSPAMELISRLAADLDPEGTYLLLNGIANQLRYPNSHTHYFSCVLLMLFAEAPAGAAGEAVQAQVTRVLLERLIVNRPHPWGLLITFIELIKNPHYKFWSHSFTRCAPDIERLFESVARSCMGPMTALPQQAAAGAKAGEVEEVKG
jgi:CCR4-NOT transcription complex subunit 1